MMRAIEQQHREDGADEDAAYRAGVNAARIHRSARFAATDDREFEVHGAAEPSDEEEPTDEKKEYYRKNFRPARPRSDPTQTTRDTTACIREKAKARAAARNEPDRTDTRGEARGKSTSSSSRNTVSSNRPHPPAARHITSRRRSRTFFKRAVSGYVFRKVFCESSMTHMRREQI